MNSRTLIALLAAAVMSVAATQAMAQSGSDEWEFTIAPYLVTAGMTGTVTVKGIEADVDLPFSDVLDALDFTLMGHFEMKNDHWMLTSDLVYMDLEEESDLALGTATTTVKQTLFEVVGGYRVSPAVTLLAGARLVDLSSALRYSGDLVDESVDAGKSWVDPLVGVHVNAPFAEHWWVGIHGDIGGFGVGSDLAWQAYANIGFRASKLVSIVAGYRAIDMDYQEGEGFNEFRYDILTAGPQIGVGFTF